MSDLPRRAAEFDQFDWRTALMQIIGDPIHITDTAKMNRFDVTVGWRL
jgi:hypothetical protein